MISGIETSANQRTEIRLDKLVESLPIEAFSPVQINLNKPKTVWVANTEVEISRLEGKRSIAIVMNASNFSQATDIDYFITNVSPSIANPEWISLFCHSPSSRNNKLGGLTRRIKRLVLIDFTN